MMEQVRIIKNQNDYGLALARLSALMDEDIAPHSELENQMELLSMVIGKYEAEHAEPVVVDAVDAILFRMEQMALHQKDLVPYLGSPSKVSEVLSRKRPLSLSMMRKIHRGLQISAEVLLGKTEQNDVNTQYALQHAP
jgi:HTH-type transcriptional regulator/antitoxin HigA